MTCMTKVWFGRGLGRFGAADRSSVDEELISFFVQKNLTPMGGLRARL